MGHARERDRQRPDGQQRRTRSPAAPSPEDAKAELEQLRQAVGNAAMSRLLEPRTSQTIEASLGTGRPLNEVAPSQRAPGSKAAGRDSTDDVRVHDDADAAELSKQLGAVAFTFGRDIFLAGDAPELESSEGQRVLRHELTHVRQQAGTHPGRPRKVSSPSSPAEREAAHAGDHGTNGTVPSPAGAVHRQEEEELMEMPASTVHRQEELPEEELMMMPAETVHRQEEDEDEEMVMTMPAETVHRQEDTEEEELAMMPAETVHRQEDTEEQVAADMSAPAPANPALAALFDATVLAKHRAAVAALEGDPADTATALAATIDTWQSVSYLSATYEDRDPLLFAQLRRYQNAVNVAMQQLRAIEEGPRGPEAPHNVLSHPQVLGLGEQLRDQLH